MRKIIIVINGKGGVGKDTLCDFAAQQFKVMNESSIDCVKEIATFVGWRGEKDLRARKFLADMKKLLSEYNDYPTRSMWESADVFLTKKRQQVFFVHIREPKEIEHFKARFTNGECVTLLIRRKDMQDKRYGNASDDDVENYNYDYIFDNDAPLDETKEKFNALIAQILEERGIDNA